MPDDGSTAAGPSSSSTAGVKTSVACTIACFGSARNRPCPMPMATCTAHSQDAHAVCRIAIGAAKNKLTLSSSFSLLAPAQHPDSSLMRTTFLQAKQVEAFCRSKVPSLSHFAPGARARLQARCTSPGSPMIFCRQRHSPAHRCAPGPCQGRLARLSMRKQAQGVGARAGRHQVMVDCSEPEDAAAA